MCLQRYPIIDYWNDITLLSNSVQPTSYGTAADGVIILYEIGLLIIVVSLIAALFRRIKLPGLIGAIVVGLFIGGPGGLGLVTNLTIINAIATLGVVLLLFVTGLEFELSEFWASGRTAFFLTSVGAAFSVIGGYLMGILLGWSPIASFILGVLIAPSGTSVIAALISSEKLGGSDTGSTLLTACIVDDVEGLILLTVALGLLTDGGASPLSIIQVIVISTVFIIGSLMVGGEIMPKAIDRFGQHISEETLFAFLLGLGLLFAYTASLIGLAAITGAFIIGAVIPKKPLGEEMAKRLATMKDLFAAIFFVSIGLVINPYTIPDILPLTLLILVAAIAARLIGGLLGGFIGGLKGGPLIPLVLALSIRAEMSLIIAREAVLSGVLGDEFLVIATVLVIGSIILTVPLFSRLVSHPNLSEG